VLVLLCVGILSISWMQITPSAVIEKRGSPHRATISGYLASKSYSDWVLSAMGKVPGARPQDSKAPVGSGFDRPQPAM